MYLHIFRSFYFVTDLSIHTRSFFDLYLHLFISFKFNDHQINDLNGHKNKNQNKTETIWCHKMFYSHALHTSTIILTSDGKWNENSWIEFVCRWCCDRFAINDYGSIVVLIGYRTWPVVGKFFATSITYTTTNSSINFIWQHHHHQHIYCSICSTLWYTHALLTLIFLSAMCGVCSMVFNWMSCMHIIVTEKKFPPNAGSMLLACGKCGLWNVAAAVTSAREYIRAHE